MKPRSGTQRATIQFHNITLDCEFNFIRGCDASMDGPAEPDRAELNYVNHKGECIWNFFDDKAIEEIEALCLAELKDSYDR